MEENAANYFASMSHLASKMMQYNESVREMYRDTWEGLSWEKQEELIDQHTIDPKIADKYASCRRTSEPVNCFPVLKINSGEKIVVDFEHDDVSLLIILVYLIHNQFVNLFLIACSQYCIVFIHFYSASQHEPFRSSSDHSN